MCTNSSSFNKANCKTYLGQVTRLKVRISWKMVTSMFFVFFVFFFLNHIILGIHSWTSALNILSVFFHVVHHRVSQTWLTKMKTINHIVFIFVCRVRLTLWWTIFMFIVHNRFWLHSGCYACYNSPGTPSRFQWILKLEFLVFRYIWKTYTWWWAKPHKFASLAGCTLLSERPRNG